MSPRLRNWSEDDPASDRAERILTAARLYSEGVRALARRELTTSQLRDKLVEAGGRQADVDAVLARLREEGALDDRRAARVYARIAFRQRKRARARILEELGRLGIADDIARTAVDEVCGTETERRRLEEAVVRALRGTRGGARQGQARTIVASLTRKGYQPDDIRMALRKAGLEPDAEA